MGFIIKESWDGRNRGSAGTSREYVVTHDGSGASDENAATDALFAWLADPANTPGIDGNYTLTDISCKELVGVDPITYRGAASWKYNQVSIAGGQIVPEDPVQPGEITFTYNAQAPGGKIVTSVGTVSAQSLRYLMNELNPGAYPDADPADFINFFGHLNAERDDKGYKYNGLDLNPPPSSFEVNWQVLNSRFNTAQVDLMRWVGTVNDTKFTLMDHEYDQGELLFLGITGTKRTAADWEVNLAFSFKRNRFDTSGTGGEDDRVRILGGRARVGMHGHDYLWIFGGPSWNPTRERLEDPEVYAGVYVEQVWSAKDWTQTALNDLQALSLPY